MAENSDFKVKHGLVVSEDIELGHATDTTIARSSAGVITVQGTTVLLSGAALGTPSGGTLTNCSGLPAANISQGTMASGMVLVAPALGTPASGALTNCTALPAAQVAQGTMASGMVLVAPALGTPASGALTNCTFPTLNQSTSGSAASLSATLAVASGGTGATSMADKAVIISQDSGTDTLAALALTTSGQLVIGGASGPAAATLTAGSNVTITNADGGITIAAANTNTTYSAGTGISLSSTTFSSDDSAIDHDSLSNFVANEHINHTSVTMTAGTGMTGGGTIAATRTLNVIGGTGITANANDIAIDSTVTTLTGTQTLTNKTLTAPTINGWKATVVAVTGTTQLTLAQSGSYVYVTGSGAVELPDSATTGTQYTIFNNKGSDLTVTLGDGSMAGSWAGVAAVADNDATSFVCVSAGNWVQVGA